MHKITIMMWCLFFVACNEVDVEDSVIIPEASPKAPYATGKINSNFGKDFHPKDVTIWSLPGTAGRKAGTLSENAPVFILDSVDLKKLEYYEYLHIEAADKSISGYVYTDRVKNIKVLGDPK